MPEVVVVANVTVGDEGVEQVPVLHLLQLQLQLQ